MKTSGAKVWESITGVIILAAMLVCAVVAIPFIPLIILYAHFSDKQFQKRYHQFLERMNGACFFCYNSRKSSVDFARNVIVPELAISIHIVFVDGNKVVADSESDYISKMLGSITERKGFPYLLKIENGQVLNLSVNNQFYSILIGRKPIAPLVDRIHAFFHSSASALSKKVRLAD